MVLQRFIKFIAQKAEEGSADHERELQNAADQFPEIVDDVIGAYLDASAPVEVEDWPILSSDSAPESIPMELTEDKKWCAWHKRMEPKSEFTVNRTAGDGLQSYCRVGLREYRERYGRNYTTRKTTTVDLTVRPFVPKPANAKKRTQYPPTAPMDAMAPDGYLWCSHCRTYKQYEQFALDNHKRRNDRRNRRTYCLKCSAQQYNN
jgi:hypothetical protein